MLPPVLLILGGVAASIGVLRLAFELVLRRGRREAEAYRRMLSAAPTAKLLELVRAQVGAAAHERFASARHLASLRPTCSDAELAAAINAYWREAAAAEPPELAGGREGVYFEMWDSGLMAIRDVLEARSK